MTELDRYYEILGLRVGALPADVKQAYRALAKLWHPDRFFDPQQKLRAEEQIKKINQAYQALKFHQPEPFNASASVNSPDTRTPAPSTPSTTAAAASTRIYASGASAAEVFYNAGAEHVKGGRYQDAIENFSSAIKLSPSYAEAYRYRGFVYSLMGLELGATADLKRAEELGLKRQKSPASGISSRPTSASPAAKTIPFVPESWLCRYTLAAHTNAVSAVAVSRDGKLLVSASWDQTIALYNLRTGKLLGRLSGHTAPVLAIALSSDGQLLASGSADHTIKLWYLHTGTLLKTLIGHSDTVQALVFSSDRQTLISGSQDGTVKIWQPGSGKLIRTLVSQQQPISAIALSPDGRQLAVGTANHSVALWHLDAGHASHTLASGARAIAFSPNGRALALSSQDQTVKLWDTQTFTLLNTFGSSLGQSGADRRSATSGSAIAFSPDGHALANGSQDGTVSLWHLPTGQVLSQMTGHADTISALAYGHDGRVLVSGSTDKAIKIWHRV